MNNLPTTLIQATYRNGKWGNNRASVSVWSDGLVTFCNGFADPMVYPSYSAAKAAFHRFIADKQVSA